MTETEAPTPDARAVDVIELDAVAAEAVDLAREAAEADAPGLVGDHLGVDADEPRVVTHYFATLDPAYVGWRWAVTVARASRSKTPTVDDVVLLPGAEAVLAPVWLPWSERLRPGDLGAGDLLPTAADDSRLVPAYFSTDDADELAVSYEIGLGRERVLSREGLLDAVDRWYAGDPGPRAEVARSAPAACATCGFYVPLAGGLHQAFGACANALAPDDGKVVAVDHGCGAHSEAVVMPVSPPPPPPLVDEAGYDVVDPATIPDEPVAAEAPVPDEPVAAASTPSDDAQVVEEGIDADADAEVDGVELSGADTDAEVFDDALEAGDSGDPVAEAEMAEVAEAVAEAEAEAEAAEEELDEL